MSNEKFYLSREVLNHLYKAQEALDKLEGDNSCDLSDSLQEIIEALEFYTYKENQ